MEAHLAQLALQLAEEGQLVRAVGKLAQELLRARSVVAPGGIGPRASAVRCASAGARARALGRARGCTSGCARGCACGCARASSCFWGCRGRNRGRAIHLIVRGRIGARSWRVALRPRAVAEPFE